VEITLIAALLPSVIKIISWLLYRSNASEETKKKYLEFVYAAQQDATSAKKIRDSFDNQKKRLDELERGKDATK